MLTRILVAAMVWLLTTGGVGPAQGASNPVTPSPQFLAQEYLRDSTQGQAAIALDLNGDGYDDLVVGAPYARSRGATGALICYLGTSKGFSPRPTVIWEGDGNLGWSLAALGKVNGKPCFAAGAISGSGDHVSLAGTVTIYQGGDQPRKLAVLEGENAGDKFGYALAVGDLNGDGIPDLIVGAPYNSPSPALYQKGAVYVFFGPDYDWAHAVKIPATAANGGIGLSLAAGDINGDGVGDLLLQASGKVIAFYGSKGAFVPNPAGPDVVFSSADAGFGKAIQVLSDLNGDGLKEVAVGADQAAISGMVDCGRLFIIKGGVGKRTINLDATPSPPDLLARIDGEANSGRFGSAILPLGDVNGDGLPDLAVSAVNGDGNFWPMTGKIFLFSGKDLTTGATVATAAAIPGNARNMHLGTSLALLGQKNWLAAGAPNENFNTGRVRLYDLRAVLSGK